MKLESLLDSTVEMIVAFIETTICVLDDYMYESGKSELTLNDFPEEFRDKLTIYFNNEDKPNSYFKSFTKRDDKFYLVLDTEEINLITPTKAGTIVYSNLFWDMLDFPINKKNSILSFYYYLDKFLDTI